MNHRLEFDRVNGTFRVTFLDPLTDETFRAIYYSMPPVISAHAPRSAIADFSHIKHFELSAAGIRTISQGPRVLPAGVPGVIVAPRDITFGMARMFQTLRNRPEVQVVRSMEEAFTLLNIVGPAFEVVG